MIDAQTAVSKAVFAALAAATSVTDLADVWQNAPEDTQPGTKGLVVIGLVSLEAGDIKGSDLDRATIEVFTYVRKPDATLLYALNAEVRNAIDGRLLAADGAAIGRPVFLSADPSLMEDGQTYWDKLRFEMFVQPA